MFMAAITDIKANIQKVIVGKSDVIELVLTAFAAGGHVLLEDVPGTGKTMLSKSLAKSVNLDFKRIQFTPDLLPADVTGLNIYNQKSSEFQLKKGPVFTNILLADEINRATPRTQSSLLECMEEKQVTIDGVTYPLDNPFFVIATENPIETAGTFQLPQAQLDRFLLKISMGTPSVDEEIQIMNRFLADNPAETLSSVMDAQEIIKVQKDIKKVFIHRDLIEYIAGIVESTRNNPNVAIGVSTRGTLAMLNAARAYAYIQGRSYVIPEDIKTLAVPVFAHRISLTSGRNAGDYCNTIITEIIGKIAVPTEAWDRE
jgi:MoxR-like ATPase